jgi:transposase
MPYMIAGIDVHKKMLAVVVADVELAEEYRFERCRFGTTPQHLQALCAWLAERNVQEVVMESTAQYWKPVWSTLERDWKPTCKQQEGATKVAGALHLAQAESNRARQGRKTDFIDAERLVKRLAANELVLSLVPDEEQRLWRSVMRRKYQIIRNRVQLQNRLESLLEEMKIKLSSLVSDLLGLSARRMLGALAKGETEPQVLAAMAHQRLRATPEELQDALGASRELNPVYRRMLKMMLTELRLLEQQMRQLDREMATLLLAHADAVRRLTEIPGLGVDSAQQIIAEVGPTAAAFESEKNLSSWAGVCPGEEESGGKSKSHRSPKGSRHLRRILNQCANAAAKAKGTIFQAIYLRLVPRLGHKQTIGAIAHRLCRLIWIILHRGVSYEERGPALTAKAKQRRTAKMIRELSKLGYRVEPPNFQPAVS